MSQRFINKTRSSLYTHLYDHALVLSARQENLTAFYQLLYLLALEFAHPGIMDMVQYLQQLQELAVGNRDLSYRHRVALHATIAGILYLVAMMTSNQQLQEHILEVVIRRRDSAPSLLPDSFFKSVVSDGPDVKVEIDLNAIEPELLFQLKEKGILQQLPEPKRGLSESLPDLH